MIAKFYMKAVIANLLFLIIASGVSGQTVPLLKENKLNYTSNALVSGTTYRQQSINTCDTWTFKERLGTSQSSEMPADGIQLPNSNYIICGSDSSALGIKGRLIKLDKQGGVVLSKRLVYGNYRLDMKHIRLFSNGRLYAAATASDASSITSTPLILCIDTANLSLISVLSLSASNGISNWKAVDLNEGRNNNIFLLSYNDSLLNVTKANFITNTIAWSKTYRARNSPRPVGIGVEYSDIYVAWNETDSGYSKAVFMSLNENNGNYKFGSRAGGKADNLNIELQSLRMVNSRARITGYQVKAGVYQPIRMNYQTTSYPFWKEVFAISSFTPLLGAKSRESDWGETIAFQAADVGQQITIVQTFADNYKTPIRAWEFNYSYSVSLNRLIRTNDGGNLIIARTTTFPQQLVITKTDSVANLPGCNNSSLPATFDYPLQAYKFDTIPQLPLILQFVPVSITNTDLPIQTDGECKSLYCPTVPEPDTCLRTFFKEYRNPTNSIVARNLLDVGAGKLMMNISARAIPYIAADQTQLTVFDTLGRLKDSKILVGNEPLVVYNFTKLADGNLLGTGSINEGGGNYNIYIIKCTPQYSIIWQKKFTTPGTVINNFVTAQLETSEGDIYCYLREPTTNVFGEFRTVLKLNSSGNVVWVQQYNIGNNIFGGSGESDADIVEAGNNVILKYNEESGDFSPHLLSFRKTDGSIVWVKKYQMPGPYYGSNSFTFRAMVSSGSTVYMLGQNQGMNILLKISADGTLLLAKKSPATTLRLNDMVLKACGKLMLSAGVSNPGAYASGIVEVDTNFNILRSQYIKNEVAGSAMLVPYSDSVTFSAGAFGTDNPYTGIVFLEKFNFNSSFAKCAYNEQPLVLDTFSLGVAVKTLSQVSPVMPQLTPYNAFFRDADIAYSRYHCGNTVCSLIDLQGPSVLCDTANAYTYLVNRNVGCNGNIIWEMDTIPGQIKILSATDTSLRIKLNTSGTFKLKVKVFASCDDWLYDSLTIQATASNSKLDLGKDTSLCPGNSYVLHAGPGFNNYLWQDGSTDSVLTATQPGLYYVEVTSCGNIIRDTVLISGSSSIPFYAGPDRTKCNSDTLHLTAPAGFLNYAWSNSNDAAILSSAAIVINPPSNVTYYIKAEKAPGCNAYDTIKVSVNSSPPIFLGVDKSLCTGDSATFDAGNSFSSYMWSTGATSQKIVAKFAGTYSVVATTSSGCTSSDTIMVNVISNPVVTLNDDSTLCTGTARILDAGNFSTYLWNTGNTTRTISVNNIGVFSVVVTDINGCKGADITAITKLLPVPANFLPSDTTVCNNGSTVIFATAGFMQYLWSTNSTSNTISVSTPGQYWLSVKDKSNCSGRDTIIVSQKECLKGIFIPTAFTPNADGINDVFKPMLFGNRKLYFFQIYNRFGQLIFETSDPAKGWNGNFKGLPQDSNVFVWVCKYQFEAEEVKTQRGTVTLLR